MQADQTSANPLEPINQAATEKYYRLEACKRNQRRGSLASALAWRCGTASMDPTIYWKAGGGTLRVGRLQPNFT